MKARGRGHGCAPSVVIFTHIRMCRVRTAQVQQVTVETCSRRVKGLKLGQVTGCPSDVVNAGGSALKQGDPIRRPQVARLFHLYS
jgi:hypothetical protein